MEIAAADGATSTSFQVHNSLVCLPLLRHGTPEQKERYLRPLACGEQLGAFCLTEPGAGSDAAAITHARAVGRQQIRPDGTKQFITSGKSADLALVFAVTDPAAGKRGISAFIVPTDTPGSWSCGSSTRSASALPTLPDRARGLRVLPDQMLGEEGQGYQIALGNLEGGRIGIAAQSVGMARAAYEAASPMPAARTFGKPIIEHQAVAFRLADMATRCRPPS